MRSIIANFVERLGLAQFSVLWGYYRASGWRRSMFSKQAVDAKGNPLPWYSYAMIHFLEQRLARDADVSTVGDPLVFEFGSGNSTLWWSLRASKVVSVEDNAQWHEYVLKHKPANVDYKLAQSPEDYIGSLADADGDFDVIIVDGSHRFECARAALNKLSPRGIVLVDNSDWPELKEAVVFLRDRGFKQLEFYSVGPINGHPWGTSVFYRNDNVLHL